MIQKGSIATGWGKLQVQPCPQRTVSDGRLEKGGLSLRANRRHSSLAGKHETDPEMRKFVAAFEQGMRAAGWIRGVNVR
jgi:hypothetical protein